MKWGKSTFGLNWAIALRLSSVSLAILLLGRGEVDIRASTIMLSIVFPPQKTYQKTFLHSGVIIMKYNVLLCF